MCYKNDFRKTHTSLILYVWTFGVNKKIENALSRTSPINMIFLFLLFVKYYPPDSG